MLHLLSVSVAVMAANQPLLEDADLENNLQPDIARTESARAVNHGRRIMSKLQKEEAARIGLVGKAKKLGEEVKDQGSGHAGATRAFEREVLVESFFQCGCYDLGHFWHRARPLASYLGGSVIGLAVTGFADGLANGQWCHQTLGRIVAENATQFAAMSLEDCETQGEEFIDKYRATTIKCFAIGVGAGLNVLKYRRYLMNLLFSCKIGNGRRLYEVDPDQKRLNAVQDDLEMLHEFTNYYLMRRLEDRTTTVCRPIYNTLNLSSIMHLEALTAAKKELEDLIEFRDHEYQPSKMGKCARFFYNVKQLLTCNRRRLTCRRELLSPAEAKAELERKRNEQAEKRYVPKPVRDALVGHMLAGKYSKPMLQRANRHIHIQEDASPQAAASSSSAGADDDEEVMGLVKSEQVNAEIDEIIRTLDHNARKRHLKMVHQARRKVRDGAAQVRQFVRSHSVVGDADDETNEDVYQPPMNSMPGRLSEAGPGKPIAIRPAST